MANTIKVSTYDINGLKIGTSNVTAVYVGTNLVWPSSHQQVPCFAVTPNISTYTDTEFIDVYDATQDEWYKLNNLNQYEKYGVYGSGRTITYYEGKLTIDDGYEYQYSGSSWNNVGEVSGDTHDYSQDYLTLQALESGTFGFSAGTVNYSTDSGSTWNTLTQGNTISVNQGDEVLFKMSGATPNSNTGIGTFTSSGRFNVYGNIMSMQESDNFATATTIANYEFYFKRLFAESKAVSAEYMVLPATTLRNFCYNELFKGSTYLTTPPKIFPATALTQDCYSSSFRECPSLTKSPILPAPTSARASYGWMFQDSTSLSEVTCLATNVSAQYATYDWLKNVASSGTFYKNPNASWSRGTSGIPSNWNAEDYVEPSPLVYPVYYDEIQDPPNNVTFTSMTEAEEYECPWVGMQATIDGDRYIFSGDSQSGYEWVEKPSILPSGYTEVEYIQRNASNNGYVGLGEYFQVNTKIEIDFQMTQAKGNAIIGDYGSNDKDDWRVFLNYDSSVNNLMNYDFLTTRIQSNTGDWSKRFHIEIGNYYIKDIDSGSYLVQGTSKSSFTRPNQMYIFHIEGSLGSGNIDYGYIYGVKIWQGETLVKEFVPCKRDSDNAVGLYDKVNNEFHGSLNSTLVAGPTV